MSEKCPHCGAPTQLSQIKCEYCAGETLAAAELPESLNPTSLEQAVRAGKLELERNFPVQPYACNTCGRGYDQPYTLANIFYGTESKKARLLTCYVCGFPNTELGTQLENLEQ